MPCIEFRRARQPWRAAPAAWVAPLVAALLLVACAGPPLPPIALLPAAVTEAVVIDVAADPPELAPLPEPLAPLPGRPRYVQLGPPATPRNAGELRLQFARRLVAAHPDTSFMSPAPDRLWAIPVIQVELNADGSVRRIDVLRKPTTGDEATVLAIEAIRRAAPYGSVAALPKPWTVVETFLFDDDLRFKPRSLDGN